MVLQRCHLQPLTIGLQMLTKAGSRFLASREQPLIPTSLSQLAKIHRHRRERAQLLLPQTASRIRSVFRKRAKSKILLIIWSVPQMRFFIKHRMDMLLH